MFIHHDFKNVYALNFIKLCFKFLIMLGFEICLTKVYGEREDDFPKAM